MMKNRQFIVTTVAALCAAGLSGPVAAIDGPVFTGIGDLPGSSFWSNAFTVSGDGNTVVGWGMSEAGTEAIRWRWEDGIQGIGDLPGGHQFSLARGVSEDGSVIVGLGHYGEPGISASYQAFRWTEAGGMVGLGDLPGGVTGSEAKEVSADGNVVVGAGDLAWVYLSENGADRASSPEAFLWTEQAGMMGLGSLPGGMQQSRARGVSVSADGANIVVGDSGFAPVKAVRWTASTGMVALGDLTGQDVFSIAYDISADGNTVVGYARSMDGSSKAFRWTEATGMLGLGDLPGGSFTTIAYEVSGDGSVIVGYYLDDAGSGPFVWTEALGMQRLQDVLEDYGLDVGAWRLGSATGVSDDGLVIVGHGFNPDGNQEGWVFCRRDSCFENRADGDGNGGDDDDDDDDDDEYYHGHGGHGGHAGHGGMMSR